MCARRPPRAVSAALAAFPWLLLPNACGGGGGRAPAVAPNRAPTLLLPELVIGTAPDLSVVLPTGAMRSLTFTADDPDGDALQWELVVSAAGKLATGLSHAVDATGPTFAMQLWSVTLPAATTIRVRVEDQHGAAATVDLRIVRSGPPVVQSIAPASAFTTLPQRVTFGGHGFQLGGIATGLVEFDGARATDVVVENDLRLSCSTPAPVAPGLRNATVWQTYGNTTLPDACRFFAFPPAFAAGDQRLGIAASVTGFDLALGGPQAHAVCAHGLIPVLTYQQSFDGGATWTVPSDLDGLETPTEPRIVAGAGLGPVPGVGAIWIGDGTSVWFATPGFAARRLDVPGTSPKRRPRLCADGDHRYASWIEGDPTAGSARIVVTLTTNHGLTWSPPAAIADGPANQTDHELGVVGGKAWTVFADDRLGARGIYAVHLQSGSGWSAPQRLSSTSHVAAEPRVAATASRVHVAWLEQGELRHTSSSDHGETWNTTPVVVQDAAGGAVAHPSIACAADRVAFAYVVGGVEAYAARIAQPGAPVQRTRVDGGPSPSAETSVHVAGLYTIVCWREGDVAAGTARVRVAVSGDAGDTFAWSGGLGNGAAAQRLPLLRHDGARFLLGWIDDRDGPPFLYSNCTTQ
jgi:hypothetical protein